MSAPVYSIPDQPQRFANAKADNNARYLDITTVYDSAFIKDKRILITGANRGIGLALAKEVTEAGGKVVALVRKSSPELDALNPAEVVTDVDVTSDEKCVAMAGKITGGKLDVVINNAGYFYVPNERVLNNNLNFKEELAMIDICALGPLRVTNALYQGGLLRKSDEGEATKVVIITSQGGSVAWRTTQCPTGGDYGHHMSKSAANMGAFLLAQEFKQIGVPVVILHPGFNQTEMTKKYEHIWEVEGAVDVSVGAKRVMYEIGLSDLEHTGRFVNCEDGLDIPW